MGGNILHIILLPKATGITEGGKTALGAYSGTGKDYDALFHFRIFSMRSREPSTGAGFTPRSLHSIG